MIYNAATLHQDTDVNNYVNQAIEQNGTLYQVGNWFAHAGVYTAEAAVLVGAWVAAGGATWGVAFDWGRQGIHVVFGASRWGGGAMHWMHGVGGGSGGVWIVGASSEYVAGASYSLTGIPILFPSAALGGCHSYNCVTAALESLRRALFYF